MAKIKKDISSELNPMPHSPKLKICQISHRHTKSLKEKCADITHQAITKQTHF